MQRWGGVNRIPESDLVSGEGNDKRYLLWSEECGVCSVLTLTELQHLYLEKIVFLSYCV